jgi:hypothetical protein
MKMNQEKPGKALAVLSLILIAGFLLVFFIIHMLNTDLAFQENPISLYVFTPSGYLIRAGLIMIGLSQLITGRLLLYGNAKNRIAATLCIIMALTAFITGILTMDTGAERTIGGTVHNYTAGLQFFLFPFCSLLYTFWEKDLKTKWISLFLGAVALVLLPFITISSLIEKPEIFPVYGMLQKVYAGLIVCWLSIVAFRFLRKQNYFNGE